MFFLGKTGQERLLKSHVLVGGVGGLGSITTLYLIAAGVGQLTIVDADKVAESDLNRQILFTPQDIGKKKVHVAARRLKAFNPEVKINAVDKHLDKMLALELAREVDLIVDCFDNWEARFYLDDAAQALGKPLVHGAVEEMYGVVTSIKPGETLSLRQIYGNPTDRGCMQVIGAAVGVIGAYQALEAIKILSGVGQPLYGKILYLDMKNNTLSILSLEKTAPLQH